MGGASPYRARLPGQSGEGPSCGAAEKYAGLVNVANTCYVNSVVQALYFCTPFRRSAIRQLHEDKEDDAAGETLLSGLAELFAQIENQKRPVSCLTPRRFLARLRKASDLFCNAEHQDAHEFMQFLLNDILDTSKKRAGRRRERVREQEQGRQARPGASPAPEEPPEEEPRTWVHDIFQGYLVNQMKCLCCESVSVRREPFLDLSVDIERHTSIAACLRAFESTERLRAGNKFFCDACGCLQEAEKRLRIYQLPSVLTLHLKRFKYVERLGRCCRLPYRVVFPLQLRVVEHRPAPQRQAAATAATDAAPRTPGAAASPAGPAGIHADSEESPAPDPRPSRLFELRSVVVHIGRDSSRGHYVTVVRHGDRCVLLDDDVVRAVGPEVLRSFYGTSGGPTGPGGQGSGGWGADGGSGRLSADRLAGSHSSGPLYERSPEGTCCGYLLIYEAVDGLPGTTGDCTADVIDVGSAADWISEERNVDDSDSGESAEEPARAPQERGGHPSACDDGELTQAFEQRCIPRGAGRPRPAAAAPAAQDLRSRERPSAGTTPASGLGGSGDGVLPVGPAPSARRSGGLSPSRVNVATVPMAGGSPENSTGLQAARG